MNGLPVARHGRRIPVDHQRRGIDGPPTGGEGQAIQIGVAQLVSNVVEEVLGEGLRCLPVDRQLPEVCGVHGSGFTVRGSGLRVNGWHGRAEARPSE